MNHCQYPGQTRAKTMCHKSGWPYLGIQPTWCVRTSPLSPASPGHWVLEYSGGGEAEEYKTGAFHLSPTVSRLSPSCKLWSALKQVFLPLQKTGCLNQENHISTATNTWRGWLTEKRQSQETRRSLFRFQLVSVYCLTTKRSNPLSKKILSANATWASDRVFQTLPR